jgi:hypothetical protein
MVMGSNLGEKFGNHIAPVVVGVQRPLLLNKVENVILKLT